jgi:hypothetical protein
MPRLRMHEAMISLFYTFYDMALYSHLSLDLPSVSSLQAVQFFKMKLRV